MELTESQKVRIRRLRRAGKSSGEIAKITRLDKGTIAAYIANVKRKKQMRRIKRRLVIIECTSESREDKSESALMKELIRILKPSVKLRIAKAFGRRPFLEELRKANELFIHISAHGEHRKGRRVHGTFITFPSGGRVHSSDLTGIWQDRSNTAKPKLIVFSACEAGHQDLAETLYNEGCRYLIAPEDETYWFDAAIFLTVFYRLLLVENHRPWVAFKKTDIALNRILPKLTGSWSFYDKGKRVCYE